MLKWHTRRNMDRLNFEIRVREVAARKPRLLALESDNKGNIKMIEAVEEYYSVKLPDCYKDFVKQYGGGYFGFIIVYSCDCDGMFYIKDSISKEWVLKKSFLPIIDLDTGDFLGFKIKDGICQNTVALYYHEENELQELEMSFYEVLLKYGLKCN